MSKKRDWSWIALEAKRRNLSITQIAQHIGVSEQAVRKWINGQSPPSLEHAQSLADIFTDGSLDRLVERAGDNVSHWVEMDQQLKATPAHNTAEPTTQELPLNVPIKLLSSNDRQIVLQTENHVVENHRLLIHARRFKQLKRQAHDVLGRLIGRRAPLTAQMLCDIAYAETMLGHYAEGMDAAQAALEADHGRLPLKIQAESHWLLAENLRSMSKLSDAREHCNQAHQLFEKADSVWHAEGPMWVEWNLSRIANLEGKLDEAFAHCDATKEMARHGLHRDGAALELWARANAHELQGNLDQAIAEYHHTKQVCRHIDYLYWEAMSEWRVAEALRKKGDLDTAMRLAQRTANTFVELENGNLAAALQMIMAACHFQQGRIHEAIKLYTLAARQSRIDGDLWMQQRTTLSLQLTQLSLESRKPSPDYGRWLPDPIHKNNSVLYENWSSQTYDSLFKAEVLRLSGYVNDAFERFAQIEQSRRASGHQLERAHALLGMADSQRLLNQSDRTNALAALNLYRKVGSVWGQIHAMITLALMESGDLGLAAIHLHEAGSLAAKANMWPETNYISGLKQGTPQSAHTLLFI